MNLLPQGRSWVLVAGDLLVIFIVTWIGFATHESSLTGTRWLATFIPMTFAWLIFAPLLQVYRSEAWSRLNGLWRPIVAVLLAAPLAAVLRGLWLDALITPIFPLILGGSAAIGMGIWRAIHMLSWGRAWMKAS